MNEIALQFEEEKDDYRSIGGAGPSYKLLRFFLYTFPISTKRKNIFLVFFKCRKLFNSIAFYGPALGLIWLSWVGCDRTEAIAALCVAVSINAGVYCGFQVGEIVQKLWGTVS